MKKDENTLIIKTSIKNKNKIIETIKNKESNQTEYVYLENDKIKKINNYKVGDTEYIPPRFNSKLVQGRILILPSEVDTTENEDLVKEISDFIRKYVDIQEDEIIVASYYILMTWIYDKFHEIPYLRVLADYGSGKTRFLRVIGELCYKAIFAGGGTTLSPIFRMMDQIEGTLVYDEADFRVSDKTSDFVKVLNNGYSNGGNLWRSEGDGIYDVKFFNIFGPKVLANRETYRDQALESRFLVIRIQRTKREDIPRQLNGGFFMDAEKLRNKLLYWRLKNYNNEINLSLHRISGVQPRLDQIASPIIYIMTLMKDFASIPKFSEFIKRYDKELLSNRSDCVEADIIKTLQYFSKTGVYRVTIGDIRKHLLSTGTFDDKYITARKVGAIIKQKLHLQSERTTDGFVIDLIKNKKDVASLIERYGVSEHNEHNER